MTDTNLNVQIAHDDHGLEPDHLAFVRQKAIQQSLALRQAKPVGDTSPGFFMINVLMPTRLPDLASALYGPTAGDSPVGEDRVRYEKRGQRPGPSRLIDAPERACRRMVIIGLDKRDEGIIVFTAYGTQSESIAPREWWDAGMKPHEAIEAATFWSQHALAAPHQAS